ncbi:hypothetical protein K5D57_00130 [Pseudomonas cichorii]|nr:hypothetical protein [Pseudomonas cichorii]
MQKKRLTLSRFFLQQRSVMTAAAQIAAIAIRNADVDVLHHALIFMIEEDS